MSNINLISLKFCLVKGLLPSEKLVSKKQATFLTIQFLEIYFILISFILSGQIRRARSIYCRLARSCYAYLRASRRICSIWEIDSDVLSVPIIKTFDENTVLNVPLTHDFFDDINLKTGFYKEFIRHVLLQRNIMKKKLNRHYKIL